MDFVKYRVLSTKSYNTSGGTYYKLNLINDESNENRILCFYGQIPKSGFVYALS